MTKKMLALLLAAAMTVCSLTACGGKGSDTGAGETTAEAGETTAEAAAESAGGEVRDTLNVVMASDAASMDSADAIDVYSQMAYGNILETLVNLDENGEVVPGLAEYEMLDDVTYQFKIKEGVLFHNGEELKASDVAFTLKRGCESAVLNYLFSEVNPDTIEIVDDYTVKFSLKNPSAPFLINLTCNPAGIVSEKAVTEAGDNYSMNPVGTGPYKFVSWEKGTAIKLEAFEDYHGEPAKIKNVVIRPIPEGTNRTIELESGGADIACDIPTTDISRVEADENLNLDQIVAYSTTFLGFNCQAEPLDDVRVRQAICYALDYEGITQSIMQGYATPASTPVSSALLYHDETAKHIPYDPEKAKSLLAEAGYPDGFDLTITCDERKERVDIATIAQSQLAEVGINVTIESLEWAAFLNKAYAGETQCFVLGWSSSVPDPDMVCYSVFHSSMIGNGNNNIAKIDDPKIDELLEKGRTNFDSETRKEAYSELYHYLNEVVPWDMMWADTKYVGLSTDVEGFKMDPSACYKFANVSFK